MQTSTVRGDFLRPACYLAMGETGRLALQRVFDGAKRFGNGQLPYHLGFAVLSKSHAPAADVHFRYVRRPTVGQRNVVCSDDLIELWEAEPPVTIPIDANTEFLNELGDQLADRAAQLASRGRLRAAQQAGLGCKESRAEIVLLIDTDEPDWWNWAIKLAKRCRSPGHRVTAILCCQWPTTDREHSVLSVIKELRDKLTNGEPAFSQLYVLGNRDQINAAINREERVHLIADYLLDRIWPASAERFQETIDRDDWVAGHDDPASHFGSFAYRTLRLDPDEIIEELRARDYREELGNPQWTKTADECDSDELAVEWPSGEDGNLIPIAVPQPSSHLVGILQGVLEPRPPQSRSSEAKTWPPIDKQGVKHRIEQFEDSFWPQVEEALGGAVPNLDKAHEHLSAAESEVMLISQRLRIDSLEVDRAYKEHHLREPKSEKCYSVTKRIPLRTVPILIALLLALTATASVAVPIVLQVVQFIVALVRRFAAAPAAELGKITLQEALRTLAPLVCIAVLAVILRAAGIALSAVIQLRQEFDERTPQGTRAPSMHWRQLLMIVAFWLGLAVGGTVILVLMYRVGGGAAGQGFGGSLFQTIAVIALAGLTVPAVAAIVKFWDAADWAKVGLLLAASVLICNIVIVRFRFDQSMSAMPVTAEEIVALALLAILAVFAIVAYTQLWSDKRIAASAPGRYKRAPENLRASASQVVGFLGWITLVCIATRSIAVSPFMFLVAMGLMGVTMFVLRRQYVKETDIRYDRLPPPYDLDLIRYAEGRLADLWLRISQAGSHLDAVGIRWQGLVERQSQPARDGGLLRLLGDDALERIASSTSLEKRDTFARAAAEFPKLVVKAVRHRQPVDEVFEPLENAFEPVYDFLHEWDINKLLEVTRGEQFEEFVEELVEGLPVSWPLPSHLSTTSPPLVAVVSPADIPSREPTDGRARCLRLYKFCRGVDADFHDVPALAVET